MLEMEGDYTRQKTLKWDGEELHIWINEKINAMAGEEMNLQEPHNEGLCKSC